MKHREEQSFFADWHGLSRSDRALFLAGVQAINRAYARRGDRPLPTWPARLRIRQLVARDGIFEMTWSFAGPAGRATFELTDIAGEPAIKWRRIGGHEIFDRP